VESEFPSASASLVSVANSLPADTQVVSIALRKMSPSYQPVPEGSAWLWITNLPADQKDPAWTVGEWEDELVSSAYGSAGAEDSSLPPLAGVSFFNRDAGGNAVYQGSESYDGQQSDRAKDASVSDSDIEQSLAAAGLSDITVDRSELGGVALRITASTAKDPANYVAAEPFPLRPVLAREMASDYDGILVTITEASGAPIVIEGIATRVNTTVGWTRPDLPRPCGLGCTTPGPTSTNTGSSSR
jgi:hypothetical protein